MPKTFLKKSAGWAEIKSIFVKKSTGWAEVKNVFLKKSTGWVKVFTKASLPDTVTAPSIRTTNTSGVGDQYDGPLAVSPIFLNENLFGKDGVYTNFTSKFGRKFTSATSASALPSERSTVVTGDLFTSGGGVTTADRTAVDEKYLFYELTVQNGSAANEIYPISQAIKMIKNYPATNSFGWSEAEEVGTQLNFNYNLENFYYNSVEASSSYIRWWRSTTFNPGGTLLKQETIAATTTGTPSSTSRTGTSSYTPTSSDIGYYIVAEIIAVSSHTRHYGYTDNYSLGSFPTDGVIGSALSFSNIQVKDYYDNKGLDNRDRWPTGTLNQYTGVLNGYDANTVLRIRYRVYNFDTARYYKPSTGAIQADTTAGASAAWDSYTSDGSSGSYISNISVNGTTATFSDYFDLRDDFFNGGGSGPTWWLEIELSAVRGGPRVYYINPYETYYISKRIDPTISASPTTVALNTDTTISGTFAGFPATPSTNAYPRQYRINFGDGNYSAWLPVGEYAYGTLNPTYSLTKQYSTAGTYTATIETIPFGTRSSVSITAASFKTAPTITSVTAGLQGGPVTANYTGGSGPFYQIYWTTASSLSPTAQYTPDASGSSATSLTDNTGPDNTLTNYMYVRSVQTAGETSVGPSNLASAWSAGYPFTMTSNAVTQNSAPTARATSNNSSSTVKYLDSITWSGGTYNNASTITSVLLYSTNTANLSSPGGDTNTSFRTANPYTLAANDPFGTPYVFAVRDKVVGINGSTYYFYSNQITSALADAVSFSYGAATSSAGGWSASINSGTQTGATYSYVSASVGSGTVNSSTGDVSASGLTSGQSSNITVKKAVTGYNDATAIASGTALTVTTYTLTYSANGGSTTPSSQTGAQGDTITLASGAGTRSGFSFGGWSIGGVTYSGGGSYTFGASNVTATAVWNAVFITPVFNGTYPKWNTSAPSNFQRITTGTANFKWGWGNGTFSFSGSVGASKGWNFHIGSTQLSAGTARTYTNYIGYTTTNDTYTTVNGVSYPNLISSLRGDVTYSASARYGSIQAYQFGTDGNEYNGSWTAGI